MKLDHKRTVLVGLAFLSICAFWQMYDNIIPLILTNTFHLDETISGAIMAADNVLALFLLPFFGALSDRTNTKIGRRMPFILGGTAAAVILMNLLPLFDNGYANGASTGKLAMFVVTLGLLLVAMGTYRSPAVALMPDVTPKPIRSRANAIINLMGAVGGISYLIVAAVLYPNSKTAGAAHVNYQPLFVVVSALMAVSVIVLYFTTNEPKLAAAEKEYEAEHPEQQLVEEEPDGSEELPKEVKRSLVMQWVKNEILSFPPTRAMICSASSWYLSCFAISISSIKIKFLFSIASNGVHFPLKLPCLFQFFLFFPIAESVDMKHQVEAFLIGQFPA